ncbi:MAG TPA: response regulator, partial [bacterium]|nr:response regulator [bacterium]
VVEDNPGDARLLEETVRQYGDGGFELIHARDLQDALERLSQARVDAVLLDLYLPDALGTETLRQVLAARPQAPVLVLTGLYNEEIGVRVLQMGAECYLSKDHLREGNLVEALKRCAGYRGP